MITVSFTIQDFIECLRKRSALHQSQAERVTFRDREAQIRSRTIVAQGPGNISRSLNNFGRSRNSCPRPRAAVRLLLMQRQWFELETSIRQKDLRLPVLPKSIHPRLQNPGEPNRPELHAR